MKKRGQFEIQFNWIFVLAAGVLILLFASVFVLKQKDISDRSVDQSVSNSLKAIIAGAEASTDTLNFVDIPKVKIEFECGKYRVGSASKSFQIMSVFAPSKIESNKLLTWTLDWNIPYRVTNFLYLTSPNVRYILVGDDTDNLAYKVNKSMPKELNKEWITPGDIGTVNDKNDAKVRFVFFNRNKEDSVVLKFSKMREEDVTALEVFGDGNKGDVEFFEKKGNNFESKGSSYYLRLPSLIGAVFTEDLELYNCVMDSAFKKLNIVTKIYKKKTGNLAGHYNNEGDTVCANDHGSGYLGAILTASANFGWPQIVAVNTNSIALELQNKQAQLHSCALIY